jgi:YegS/Rv2252/BmrU family lipid kinase
VRGEADGDRIAACLGDAVELQVTNVGDEDDLGALARKAVQGGAAAVVAGGGDGTVSAVAAALVGTDVALGILPLGTSNSIADALGLPTDIPSACAVIARGERRAVDTAHIGEHSMLLMAAIGLQARAVTEATPEAKARLGVIAYVGKALEVLLDQEPFTVDLEFPEGPCLRLVAHAVTIANLVPPRSVLAQGPPAVVPDDGLLDVTIVAFSGALDALATSVHLYARALAGLPAERDGVAFTRVAKLTVRAEPAQELMIDGEHVGCTPFTVECRPRSLQVLV